MTITSTTSISDGVTATFSIPFPFFSRTHVSVLVNDVAYTGVVTWVSDSLVSLAPIPASGVRVTRKRITPDTPAKASFTNTNINASGLNNNQTQDLYLAQEAATEAARTLRVVAGEAGIVIGGATTRAGMIQEYDEAGASKTTRTFLDFVSQIATLLGLNQLLSGLAPAANKLAYFTSSTAMALTDLAAQARSFLADPDSQYVNFVQGWAGGALRTARSKLRDFSTLPDAGAVGDGVADDAAAINAALASGKLVIDGLGLTYKINSSVTVPAGVTFQNARIVLGTAGINGVLVNTGSKLVRLKITGTGTLSTVERAIYPAADGVSDVYLDVEVTNLTYGVHAQYLTTDTDANTPKRWTGFLRAKSIVGTAGASEGYALLLSPADNCNIQITAKTIARHAVYLSAGARGNRVVGTVDGCNNYAAQIFSTGAQGESSDNYVELATTNLAQNVAGESGPCAIIQNSHRNTVIIRDTGANTTKSWMWIEGASGGPYPSDNKVGGVASGQYTGPAVCGLQNQQRTVVLPGTQLLAKSTNYVVGFLRAGTNGATHGGYIDHVVIDAQGANIHGIYNECNAQPVFVGPHNYIRNFGSGTRISDASAGYQRGLAAAIPSQGESFAGEVTLNSVPVAGGTPGWVCTTSGTPGTWKAQAVLAV